MQQKADLGETKRGEKLAQLKAEVDTLFAQVSAASSGSEDAVPSAAKLQTSLDKWHPTNGRDTSAVSAVRGFLKHLINRDVAIDSFEVQGRAGFFVVPGLIGAVGVRRGFDGQRRVMLGGGFSLAMGMGGAVGVNLRRTTESNVNAKTVVTTGRDLGGGEDRYLVVGPLGGAIDHEEENSRGTDFGALLLNGYARWLHTVPVAPLSRSNAAARESLGLTYGTKLVSSTVVEERLAQAVAAEASVVGASVGVKARGELAASVQAKPAKSRRLGIFTNSRTQAKVLASAPSAPDGPFFPDLPAYSEAPLHELDQNPRTNRPRPAHNPRTNRPRK